VAGVQITIGDGENSEDSKDRYLFLSDIQNQTPQGVYLQGLQGWGAMPDPTDTEKPYCLDTKNPIYAKWRDPKDGRIYRLVLMPDAKWWFAQSYAYAENGWVYNGNEDYRAAYGGMYNLSIANSNTPNGWRMANNADFNTLISAVGGTDIAGRKLKSRLNTRDNGATSASNPTWMYYNDTTLGTDDYGFGIITSGERASYNGGYYSIGSVAYIMSLEANSCYYASSDDVIFSNGYHNNNAFSVRYIKQ
jgi:uncharacterized protein (TIGR02145 family)